MDLIGVLNAGVFSTRQQLKTRPNKILINLCLALIGIIAVFLAGIDSTGNQAACKTVGVLIHYFILSALLWMGIEAFNLYLLLVLVFSRDITHFILKCSLVGWGEQPVVLCDLLSYSWLLYVNRYSRCYSSCHSWTVHWQLRWYCIVRINKSDSEKLFHAWWLMSSLLLLQLSRHKSSISHCFGCTSCPHSIDQFHFLCSRREGDVSLSKTSLSDQKWRPSSSTESCVFRSCTDGSNVGVWLPHRVFRQSGVPISIRNFQHNSRFLHIYLLLSEEKRHANSMAGISTGRRTTFGE